MRLQGTDLNDVGRVRPLIAHRLPWIGSTFRSTATGFAPAALGVAIVGLNPQSTPLSVLHPAGRPGCDLLASTEAVLLAFPVGGAASYQFDVPNHSALVGVALWHQFGQIELDASFNILSLSSSNALALVVGSF